jgi:hypothetical protein
VDVVAVRGRRAGLSPSATSITVLTATIRNHTARHFSVQHVARAAYREILERRAKENSVDFIEGVATAITPMAFLESVMVKAAPAADGDLPRCPHTDTV